MIAGGTRSLASRAKPVTDDELAKLRRLHGEGLSCRQIAEQLSRAPVTVSRHARQLGLSFAREQTRAATSARVADLASLRAETSARFLSEANRLLDKIGASTVTISRIGGTHNSYTEAQAPGWGPGEIKDLMSAAAMAFDKHLGQNKHDAERDTGGSAVDQWLAHMMGEEPPASENDHDETAKAKTLLGGLFDKLTDAYGDDDYTAPPA